MSQVIEPRKQPLPHDLAYVLDGALEEGEITAFSHVVLNIFGESDKMDSLVNEDDIRVITHNYIKRADRMVILDEYAHFIARRLPEQDQAEFFACTLSREPLEIKNIVEVYAGWNYEDATIGGCLEDFLDEPRMTREGYPTPKVFRNLRSPAAIRRYVTKHPTECNMHNRRAMRDRLRRLPWPTDIRSTPRIDSYFEEQRERHRLARRRAAGELFGRPQMPRPRKERRQIKRAAALAASVLGTALTSQFCHGAPVQIAGGDLVFEATLKGGLGSTGHGAVDIGIRDGETFLSNLCLFFEEMPALDQLVALAMYVSSGNGADLINIGNLYNLSAEGAGHPAIQHRIKQRETVDLRDAAAALDIREVPPSQDRQLMELHWKEYESDTLHIYTDAVEVALWGPDVFRYRRLIER